MFFDILSQFVSAIGSFGELNAQARSASFNKRISLSNASSFRESGAIEEDRVRREARKRLGAIRANVGASGFSLEGSPLDVLTESAYNAEFDALATRYNFETQARSQELQAGLYGAQARGARRAGFIGAASSLLKGAAPFFEGTTPFKLGGS